jgi:hypothetical protein
VFIFESFIRIRMEEGKALLGIDSSEGVNGREVDVGRGFT